MLSIARGTVELGCHPTLGEHLGGPAGIEPGSYDVYCSFIRA
jgi:hypothetical protein